MVEGAHEHARSILSEVGPLSGRREPAILAIDGHSGSGKTSLALALAERCPRVSVVHVDLFRKPSSKRPWPPAKDAPAGHEFELERLEREVLSVVSRGNGAAFAPRDFHDGTLLEPVAIRPEGIVVIEGIYTLVPRLRKYYDYSIWVDCPIEICMERVLARDGKGDAGALRERFEEVWFPQELRYAAADLPARWARRRVETGVVA